MQNTACCSSARSYAWPFIAVLLALSVGKLLSSGCAGLFVSADYLPFLGGLAILATAGTILASALACLLAGRKPGGLVVAQLLLAAALLAVPALPLVCNQPNPLSLPRTLILLYAVTALPFCVLRLRRSYAAIPATMDDAATLDGLTSGQRFRKVVFPHVARDIAAALLFSFGIAFVEALLR
jgi:N,N'-diacetylchitobiose transport system permease protein